MAYISLCTSPGLRETLMDYTMYTDLPAEQSLRSRVGACDDRDWCRLQGIEGLLSTYLFELSGDCAYILIMGKSCTWLARKLYYVGVYHVLSYPIKKHKCEMS